MSSSAKLTAGQCRILCFSCDADRQQLPWKLEFRWGWDAGKVWTLLEFRRLIYPLTRLFSRQCQQTPPPPNLPTNHNEVLGMGTLMELSVFVIVLIVHRGVIVLIVHRGVIGTCDRMHRHAQEPGCPEMTSCSICDSWASFWMPPMCMQRGRLHCCRVHSSVFTPSQ